MHPSPLLRDTHARYRDSLLQQEPPEFRWLSQLVVCRCGESYHRIRALFDRLAFACGPAARFLTWQDAANYSYLRAPWISQGGRSALETVVFVKRYGAGSTIWPFRVDGGQLCVYSTSPSLRAALHAAAPDHCLEIGDSLCLDLLILADSACQDLLVLLANAQGALLEGQDPLPPASVRIPADEALLSAWAGCPDAWL